ncbi:MAG: hypothetical protein HC780_19015 [Leptolyngbyaceae cyanobacterium CSU_1_3]|nr:hypothetical protein [Leptolyngbyaceae cyanobacterium CSU_1_3]
MINQNNVVPENTVDFYKRLVWLESEAMLGQKDPQKLAKMALQLAEFTATLARLAVKEAEAPRRETPSEAA